MTEIRHGTKAGRQAHQRLGIPLCQPCRDAEAAYQRLRRRMDPEKTTAEAEKTNARERAVWRLARIYPREFQVLVADELRAAERQRQREAS